MAIKASISTDDLAALTGLSPNELIGITTVRNGSGRLLLAVECFVLDEHGNRRIIGPKVNPTAMRATYYIPVDISTRSTPKTAVADATASKRIVRK